MNQRVQPSSTRNNQDARARTAIDRTRGDGEARTLEAGYAPTGTAETVLSIVNCPRTRVPM
ncbi:hypothetical protein GCM10027408_20800 [Microbacterium tumbae]